MSWLDAVKHVPADGKWHPAEVEPGQWQAVQRKDEGIRSSWCYDTIEYRSPNGDRRRKSNLYDWESACATRCVDLNAGNRVQESSAWGVP